MDKNLLEQVAEITSGDRRRDYGTPLVNHMRIAIIWSVYLKKQISPVDVAWLMNGLKLSRYIQTAKYDDILDAAGYMVCIDNMAEEWVNWRNKKIDKKEALIELGKITSGEMFDYLLTNGV